MTAHPAHTPLIARPVRLRLNAHPSEWGAQAYAELGVAVALAAVLGQVRLFAMPQGGSVSLELLPIVFIAVRRGVVPALAAGVCYGFLQLALPGAVVFSPVQALLDYPLAFGALAIAGLVTVTGWGSLALAVGLACTARLGFHFLSGLVFFAEYAPEWEAPWLYALTYNLLYLVPEALLTTVLLMPLLKAYDAAFPAGRGAA